jgi:hypothetical protein
MYRALLKAAGWTAALSFCAACAAQSIDASSQDTSPLPAAISEPAAMPADCCLVAEGTLVVLEILEPLNSATVKRGDKFRLRLAEDLVSESRVLVPAGTEGIGEIVHANASRGGGKPGELLLAARYLDHQGRQIPLRGLKLGGRGQDTSRAAMAASMGIGPFALFIHGKEIEVPAGTQVTAKLAVALALPSISPSMRAPLDIASEATAEMSSASDSMPEPNAPSSNPPQE